MYEGKLEIEKGIPIPPKKGGKIFFPFDEMEVGDSFFVPVKEKNMRRLVNNKASKYAGKSGKKFTTRTVEGGIRCWRIA
jgi:hypothetical protein